jgi:hypothetical protein
MFPRFANIHLAPFTDEEMFDLRVGFWSNNVYGLDFTPVQYAVAPRRSPSD